MCSGRALTFENSVQLKTVQLALDLASDRFADERTELEAEVPLDFALLKILCSNPYTPGPTRPRTLRHTRTERGRERKGRSKTEGEVASKNTSGAPSC